MTAAIAAARKSIARSISPCASRSAWETRRSVCSAVTEERVGDFAERLHDEQVAQMARQVAHELGEVAPGVGQPLHGAERRLGVVLDQRPRGVEHQLGVGHPRISSTSSSWTRLPP